MRPNSDLLEKPYMKIALLLSVWTAFGLFFGTQNYLRDIYLGKNANLAGYLAGWVLCGYSWAILTIPVLWFARRFAFVKLRRIYFFPIHILAGAVFAALQLALYLAIASLLFDRGAHGVVEYYQFLLASEFQSSLLVYFAIVATVNIYDHFFGDRAKNRISSPLYNSVEENRLNGDLATVEMAAPEINGTGAPLRRIPVKDNARIVLLDAEEITYITSDGNYVRLHAAGKKYMLRDTMNSMEKKLDPAEFVRIRRSTIVRVDQIREFRPMFNGEFEIVLKSGDTLSSSRRYRKNLELLIKS